MTTKQKRLSNLKNITQDFAFLGAIAFTIFLYILEEITLNLPQITYLKYVVMLSSPNRRIAGILSTLLAFFLLAFFIWASSVASYKLKIVYGFIFSSAVAIQYGYWNAFHRFISVIDFQTAIKSPFDLWATATVLFFNGLSLVPIAIYITLLLLIKKPHQNSFFIFLGLSVVIIGVNIVNYYIGYKQNAGVSVLSFFQTVTHVALSDAQFSSRETITFKSDTKPKNNIVLVIDESIRGDHLSINGYKRPTTPYLEKLTNQGYVYNWGIAASGATCSPMSNALLITGTPVTTNSQLLLSQYPTLFHYAKAMDYETYYFDAQTSYLWNGLYISDLDYVDNWVKAEVLGDGLDRDFEAATQINKIVTESVGNFIVLNKRGVHFLYEHSYLPEYSVWTPTPPNADYKNYPELAVNAYDNGILFNVDTFFKSLLPDVTTAIKNTTYIYTADHGQTLFENNVSWLHCNFTKNEASVPLLIIGSFENPINTNYKASHSNIFATTLDLMAVPDFVRLYNYAPSLISPISENLPKRQFFDGRPSIINFDN